MSDCDRYIEMMSAMLDGELTARDKTELETHLASCPDCRAVYEALTAVSGALTPEEVPSGLHSSIMSGVREAAGKRKKHGVLVRLRPYLVTAACLAIVVAALLTARDRGAISSSGSAGASAATTEAADADPRTAEAPAAYSIPEDADDSDAGTDEEPASETFGVAASGACEAGVSIAASASDIETVTEKGSGAVMTPDEAEIWLEPMLGGDTGGERFTAEVAFDDGTSGTVYLSGGDGQLLGSLSPDMSDPAAVTSLDDLAALAAGS